MKFASNTVLYLSKAFTFSRTMILISLSTNQRKQIYTFCIIFYIYNRLSINIKAFYKEADKWTSSNEHFIFRFKEWHKLKDIRRKTRYRSSISLLSNHLIELESNTSFVNNRIQNEVCELTFPANLHACVVWLGLILYFIDLIASVGDLYYTNPCMFSLDLHRFQSSHSWIGLFFIHTWQNAQKTNLQGRDIKLFSIHKLTQMISLLDID